MNQKTFYLQDDVKKTFPAKNFVKKKKN